tara:strand:- start:243 stop:1664 length:1422 start_codon:yes stop_codon:yes gene_type:complete
MFIQNELTSNDYISSNNINDNFISLFNKPGPYYTSYPVLGEWNDFEDTVSYENALLDFFSSSSSKPLYLYLHIPYCAKLCYYCGCQISISNNRGIINNFVQCLIKEIKMLEKFFLQNKITPNIKEIHLGGGTPSHLTTDELDSIIKALENFVNFKGLQEFSMEVDPRTVNFEHFDYYEAMGVDRISFGIQDFNDVVQEKINRVQPYQLIERLMNEEVRDKFRGVNFDLLFGLPMQTRDSLRETIELTKQLSPERITLLKYLHIPNKVKHMKMINESSLPNKSDLPYMFVDSTEALIEAGYSWVGIDHFAKQTDSLSIAKDNGKVSRNFGGVNPGYTKDIISLGPSSTSAFGNYYFQATSNLLKYKNTINEGHFAISRKYKLNSDDIIRRECNFELQCNQKLDMTKIENDYKICFQKYFSKELELLKDFEEKGLVYINDKNIVVTTTGRYFVRHICRLFDTILDSTMPYQPHGT